MRKRLWITVLAMALVLLLAGCGCEHEWVEANCTSPKTCSLCEKTEGTPLGHTWTAATCTAPKTCEVCNATEGEAKGHTWEDATCLVPMKCSTCHETQGEPKGHNWAEATTDVPKTCLDCQTTEGSRIITDPRFTTAATKDLHGHWTCEVVFTGEMMGMEGYIEELPCTLHYRFGNAGELAMEVELHDAFAFKETLKKMTADELYAEYANYGYSKSATDAAFKAELGMTVTEYADAAIEAVDLDMLFSQFTMDGVYYVGENGIYSSLSWYNEFECSTYTLENGVLIIDEDVLEEGGEPLQWKRAEEEK